MRCNYCGYDVPDGMLICPSCGHEIRIVPDYNPLDDVVADEIRGSLRDATRKIDSDDLRNYSAYEDMQRTNSTRAISSEELQRIRHDMDRKARETQKKRQNLMRKKKQQQKRRQRALIIIGLLVILVASIGTAGYMTSYTRYINKGNKALSVGDISMAEKSFKTAMKKNASKPQAYTGLSETYLSEGDKEKAESIFLSAVSSQPSNIEIYKAAISFYEKEGQTDKISSLLGDCEYETVLAAFPEYISEKPEFSLAEGTYDEVQQVSLSAKEGKIYYTVDGSDPTVESEKYEKPILVQTEGETVIKAIAVNKKNIPSLIAKNTYTINFPIEDAPSVTPSTGQYENATTITINVPDGYTAYYTLDDTDPSKSDTAKTYDGPVDMPSGQTMFSAVLYNNTTGKYTLVTKRNYYLDN